jgi:hypothetical protein
LTTFIECLDLKSGNSAQFFEIPIDIKSLPKTDQFHLEKAQSVDASLTGVMLFQEGQRLFFFGGSLVQGPPRKIKKGLPS